MVELEEAVDVGEVTERKAAVAADAVDVLTAIDTVTAGAEEDADPVDDDVVDDDED